MAAAAKTESNFRDFSGGRVISQVVKATQNDWIVLPYKGVIPIAAEVITGAAETLSRPTLTVNNEGDAYDDETALIAYDGATALTRPASDYYFQTASGEIVLVGADSGYDGASGNLTVTKRACLGTTASATGLANNNTLYLLGSLVLAGAATGVVRIIYVPYPEDPSVSLL